MKPYRIFLLGGLRFQNEQRTITRFRTQKTATLLAYLALHRGAQPREVLADLLWSDDAPDAARHSLRMALSSLRGQLETTNQPPLFETTRFSIGLRTDAVSTDVSDFDEAIQSARRAASAEQRAHFYGVAVELAGGAFLPGFYDEWCLEAAARLEIALDEARQFLAQWRAATPQPTVRAALPQKRQIAPSASATKIATLLLCDGAAPSSAIKQKLKIGGGIGWPTNDDWRHAWQFSSASAALEGATWLREGTRRLALCTGEISAQNPDRLWTRARGLLESAAPGQTVCCEATALLERERADVKCRDLGVFHLPGAPTSAPPERIFQIKWVADAQGADETADAAREFAPLQARAARGARVPRPLDRFFGRETELATLRAHLQNHRLVTLTGAGGAGKTRLALQLAANCEIERAAPFYGAVYWVALADVPDASGIAAALCDALHLELDGGATSPFDAATASLHTAPATLLVFDNFEHLAQEGATLVEQLLERAPAARALITSRRLLDVRGEIAYTLAPLGAPTSDSPSLQELQWEPSVQLFCDRARWARPDFALTARNAATVAALCRQLEGIPLALELAAARVGQMSPTRILARLQTRVAGETSDFERLDWLRNTARTSPARHRTLRAALRWSVDELTPARRQLLARLSVFRGGCAAQDAEHICQMPDAGEQLEALRARSLLVRNHDDENNARYSMLETVRQYAHELAQERDEIEDLQRRHTHYFLSWAQTEAPAAVAPDARARLQSWGRVRTQADNLRAALRWSKAREPLTALQLILACNNFSGAHLSRDELDIAAVLRAIQTQLIAPNVLAEAFNLAAVQAAHHGDIAAQNEFALRHLDLIRESPDASPNELGWAYFHWGSARRRSGHTSLARAALQQSLELFAQLEAPRCHQCHGWTLIEMGDTAFDAGDLPLAAADFERCDLAFTNSGDRDGQASARAQLADVCFHAGDHARATQLWAQVAAIMHELGDEREHEWRRHQEGKHAVAVGDLERGHALLLRALRAFRSDGQKLGMLRSLLALSQFWLARGNSARARQLLQAEAAERKNLGWPVDAGWEPLRQQLWQHARADERDDSPTLLQIVEDELSARD